MSPSSAIKRVRAFPNLKGATALFSSTIALCLIAGTPEAALGMSQAPAGQPGAPYPDMPPIAPIGVRVDRYLPVPEQAMAPRVDPAKGYRIQRLGRGLYLVTDNAIQSMFMVYDKGVVVIDAPQAYSAHLKQAIREVTDLPVTHVIYSHSHADHIGGVTDLGGHHPIIIAQEETKRLLTRDNDPKRPLPTVTFKHRYNLRLGSQRLELSYHGVAHEPGNIFIYAPEQKVLMVVDVVFPGWMPWRRLALAQDVPGFFEQVALIDELPFDTFVGGHVSRVGTHADVRMQLDFISDLRAAAATALKTTEFGANIDPKDKSNPWAIFDNYIDRVAAQCVNTLTPKWQPKLAAFDVYVWDQCFTMEQSIRID